MVAVVGEVVDVVEGAVEGEEEGATVRVLSTH